MIDKSSRHQQIDTKSERKNMDIKITPKKLQGTLNAIPSKSHAHRVLIARSLAGFSGTCAQNPKEIPSFSIDISATKNCLASLFSDDNRTPVLDCRESGSTLRFLIPAAAAVCDGVIFAGSGKLPQRPISPLRETMEKHGCIFHDVSADTDIPDNAEGICVIQGKLLPGRYSMAGNVSSQFITGLLFALPLLGGDSTLSLTTGLESAGYVDLTLKVLKDFGIRVNTSLSKEGLTEYQIPGRQKYHEPEDLSIEGDWSNAACWLACGALGGKVTCRNLDMSSSQMDKTIVDILKKMGAAVDIEENSISVNTVQAAPLTHEDVSAAQTPDLVPVLSSVMAAAAGTSHITDAQRLRIKESDRLSSVCSTLQTLGADISVSGSGLTINGRSALKGGTVDSHNDHRIVMTAAAASCICSDPVIITGAEAINKSYPGFFEDFKALGGIAEEI